MTWIIGDSNRVHCGVLRLRDGCYIYIYIYFFFSLYIYIYICICFRISKRDTVPNGQTRKDTVEIRSRKRKTKRENIKPYYTLLH